MRRKRGIKVILSSLPILLFVLTTLISSCGIVSAQPPIPSDYSGYVTVNGEPAPDGALVHAKIGGYTSGSVEVAEGRYQYLIVKPPDDTYEGETIEFYVDPDAGGPLPAVMAEETSTFEEGTSHDDIERPRLDLTVVIVDATPPVISSISSSDVTTSGAKIKWSTDEPSTSRVEYGKTNAYGSMTQGGTAPVTSHSVTLTGLEAGTTYHFRVVSTDWAGNKARSLDHTFTTATETAPPGPGPGPGPVPANDPPVADAGPDKTAYVATTVHFSGAGSSDPDGTIASYEWDFGDGDHASGVEAEHAYAEEGTYSATLTVTDDDEASDSDSCTVTVRSVLEPAAEVVEAVPANQTGYVVDASAEADTTVTVNTTAPVNVTVLRYEGNPHPDDPMPEAAVPKFVDVSVSDPDAVEWPIYVEMTYTDEEVEGLKEGALGIYYWRDGAWHRCSDTGVDTERKVVWAYMTREEAAGSPILIGESQPTPQLPPILSDLTITPAEIELWDDVTIAFVIENIDDQPLDYIFEMQIGNLTLLIDVELEAHESKAVSRTITPDSIGRYDVWVVGLTGSFEVVAHPPPPKPAKFEFSNLEIGPMEVEEGLAVEVSVEVRNVGEEEGTHTIHLYVNGKVEGKVEVTLAGGESHMVYFNVEKGVGTYQVEVEGLTGGFTVFANPARPFWMRPDYVAGILIVIIAAAAIAYTLLRRQARAVD